MEDSSDITALLVEWDQGGGKGDAALVEAIYGELRRLAAGSFPPRAARPLPLSHCTRSRDVSQAD